MLLDVFRAYPDTARPLLDYHQALLRGAALDFVDANGLAALSIHKLGAELGVQGMSLHSHVESKDADSLAHRCSRGWPWRARACGRLIGRAVPAR